MPDCARQRSDTSLSLRAAAAAARVGRLIYLEFSRRGLIAYWLRHFLF